MAAAEVKLMLPDGSAIMSDGTHRTAKQLEAPQLAAQLGREIESGRRAQATLERMHRKLVDLPETPQKMNAIACVLMYTHVGLSNDDIAIALQTTAENVKKLKELEAYQQLAEMLDNTVFEDAKTNAKHIIAKNADVAASTMVNAMASSDESVAVVAAKEVMRIAGVGEGREGNRMSGLRIVVETDNGEAKNTVSVSLNGSG